VAVVPAVARSPRPLLLVTVGSDHHAFDRVIDWVDRYLDARRDADLRYVCQHGAARPSRHGEQRPFVEHAHLLRLLGEASAVVSHGGPGTLLESLQCGRVPIAVPRLKDLGEVVDDHQQAFCRFLAERGQAVVADTEQELHDILDRVLVAPDTFASRRPAWDAEHAASIERFAELVDQCRPAGRGQLLTSWRHRRTG
jgi:UDP-N-acetylglucosamine transferase subunit ALG13